MIFVGLIANVPLIAIPEAVHDDGLFVRGAFNIVHGQWLGPYDNLTLAKGPVYPLWIAFSWVVGLPILVSQAIAYASACLLLVRGLRPWLRSEKVCLAFFLLLLFNPATYSLEEIRAVREGIYVPFTVTIFALLLWWHRWRQQALPRRLLLALILGVLLGCFWCTREEGVWILPALAAAFLAILFANIFNRSQPLTKVFTPAALKHELILIGLVISSSLVTVTSFALLNYFAYGVFDVVELKQRAFVAAYGSLTRIKQDQQERPYVVIPRAVMEKAYVVSPAAAELKRFLYGPSHVGLTEFGCATYGVKPCDGEIRAAWFVWALRDAVAEAGYYRSAPAAREFYLRIGQEVDRACDSGRLDCLPPRQTLAPPFRLEYLSGSLHAMRQMLAYISTMQGLSLPQNALSCHIVACSSASRWTRTFLDMLHARIFVPAPWISTPGELSLPTVSSEKMLFQHRSGLAIKVLEQIIRCYRWSMPWLSVAALIAYGAALILTLRRRRSEPLLIVASIAALVVGSRLSMLAYLETTSMPSLNSLYLSPAYPAFILFGTTALAALYYQVVDGSN